MSAKIIVTGGAGFIGSNLVAALNERGETDLCVVDAREAVEKRNTLTGLHYSDFLDKDAFRALLQRGPLPGTRAVFHLGACSSTTEQDADFLTDNNTQYTRELCEWCLAHGVRFIYASSAATYGDGSLGYSDSDSVTPTLKPMNLYGGSKQRFDEWALRGGLLNRIAGIKYFNVYGPREDHKGEMRSVAHKAYHQILETGEVRLFRSHNPRYKDGEQLRDFMDVRDAVAVTLFFLDHPEVSGLYNCGTGKARTWNDLAKAVFAALKKPVKIRYIDIPEEIREKYQYRTQADMTKLRAAGYREPFTELEAGVAATVTSLLASARVGSL